VKDPGHAPHPVGDGDGGPDQGRWRPWRFRMSNDVWGTPAVAGALLYVTSFEVHALDTGTGRRVFRPRDVAGAQALDRGPIPPAPRPPREPRGPPPRP
ncbi:PQQ-binding-like beta-propeller repeat protein, partial [Streptomyces sp. HSW2009]|uniref:PQQ-binding-like beta-propeller repeat protein n=1 Tax=Streptomyces sp. HSW2009 TaxID=3142890 RepID=UPI0032EE4CCB